MTESIRDIKLIVKNASIIRLDVFRDNQRGDLFVAETKKHIPFEIKRAFFINNFTDKQNTHGNHAHYELQQAIFCANGSFTLILDDGKHKQEILMDDHATGVYMGPNLWRVMTDLSSDCVILVVSDSHYSASDYIRDYDVFRYKVEDEK